MPPRTLRLTLALVVVLAAVVAGAAILTGGDARPLTAEEYRTELATTFAGLRLDANPTDGGAMRDYAGQFRDVADELDDIVPPADAAAAHARLVAGLEQYARQLESLADAGREGAVRFQLQLAENGRVAGRAWVDAFDDLAARGYATR